MRLARLFAACLLGAGVSMFTSCGSMQIGSTVGAAEVGNEIRSENADFRLERVIPLDLPTDAADGGLLWLLLAAQS